MVFSRLFRSRTVVTSAASTVSAVVAAVAHFDVASSSAPSSSSPSSSSSSSSSVEDKLVVLSGTANRKLSEDVAKLLNTRLLDVTTKRFSDGEINCVINESIRGKDVFIIQTCSAPVNDNIMELLLTVAAARRAGAHNVSAVIPYFGYKYHRRGMPISTTYNSRFLWSAASDLAKMLHTVGVDNVVSVDLQRAGQGHEATFFTEAIPVETINTSDIFAEYFATQIQPPMSKVVVVSANNQCVKKARKFQRKLKAASGLDEVDYAVFLGDASHKQSSHDLLGDVRGADVIIIDDIVDTAAQLAVLTRRIKLDGAKRVWVCASHGLFSQKAMELIDLSPIEGVVVTDSVPLPATSSAKIAQVSIAPLLARVIETERHIRAHDFEEDDVPKFGKEPGPSDDDDAYVIEQD